MLPYAIVFSITIFLSYIYEKRKDNGKSSKFLLLLIIVLLSLFAAVRNDDIGKDIITYVKPIYQWAENFDLINYMKIGNLESGYKIFNFILTGIFHDYHFILFFIEFIISFEFLTYIKKLKNRYNISFTFGVFIFLFFIYNDTLVMMRQMIAISIILNSYECLLEKNSKKTILLFIIAMLFHKTALIALVGYLVIFLNSSKKIEVKTKFLIYLLMMFIGFTIIVMYKNIFNTLSMIPFFGKITLYLNSVYDLNSVVISKSILIFKIIWLIMAFIYFNNQKEDKNKVIYLIFVIIDLIIYFASFKMTPLMRFGYYFYYPAIIYLSSKIKLLFKNDLINKFFINFIIIFLVVFNWYFNYVINNISSNTVPYKSDIIENFFERR